MIRIYLFLMVILCVSCAHNEFEYLVDRNSQSTVEPVNQLEDEFFKQNESELMAMRQASIVLSEYIKLEDNSYKMEITMEEAKELGVSEENYKIICNQIDTANATIADAIKNGQEINLPNIQKLAKEYKDPHHRPTNNRSIFNAS